jgi:hypothetical protein
VASTFYILLQAAAPGRASFGSSRSDRLTERLASRGIQQQMRLSLEMRRGLHVRDARRDTVQPPSCKRKLDVVAPAGILDEDDPMNASPPHVCQSESCADDSPTVDVNPCKRDLNYTSSSLSPSLMNTAGPATGSFARNARLLLSDAQGGALRGQRSCEGTLTKGRKSLAVVAPVLVAESAFLAAHIRHQAGREMPLPLPLHARSARSEQTFCA